MALKFLYKCFWVPWSLLRVEHPQGHPHCATHILSAAVPMMSEAKMGGPVGRWYPPLLLSSRTNHP